MARILTDNWKNLSDDERASYGKIDPIYNNAKELKKQVLDEFKDNIYVLKAEPIDTQGNVSFIGEDYRAAKERWENSKESKESNDSKSSSIGGKTKKNRKKLDHRR